MSGSLSKRLRGFWRARTRREQYLLACMCALFIVYFSWFEIIIPFSDMAYKNRELAQRLAADVNYLKSLSTEISKLSGLPSRKELQANELIALLEQAMVSQGFDRTGLNVSAEGTHAVRLYGETQFDAWVSFMAQLAHLYQVRVERYSTRAGSVPGQVQLEAVLVHGGSKS